MARSRSCQRLTQDCSGLHVVNHRTVEIRLKSPSESFFLQLASPETSIWSREDIDEKTLELKPTKFSGPYSFTGFRDRAAILVRNELNPISKAFPLAAREIHLVTYSLKEAEEALKAGKLDVIFKGHNPYGEADWKEPLDRSYYVFARNWRTVLKLRIFPQGKGVNTGGKRIPLLGQKRLESSLYMVKINQPARNIAKKIPVSRRLNFGRVWQGFLNSYISG